ncbi:MAG TPA: hypothetical protein VIP46_22065 [Pyrinomonadaceae bacterium]
MNPKTDQPDDFKPTLFVVVSRTQTSIPGKGKSKRTRKVVASVVCRLDDAGTPGEREIYGTALQHKAVGGVYQIEASATSMRSATARYIDRFDNLENAPEGAAQMVVQWQLQARAFELELTAAKRERDEAKPLALDCLRPILTAYNRTNFNGRLAIEVLVLNYLRTSGAHKFGDDED